MDETRLLSKEGRQIAAYLMGKAVQEMDVVETLHTIAADTANPELQRAANVLLKNSNNLYKLGLAWIQKDMNGIQNVIAASSFSQLNGVEID